MNISETQRDHAELDRTIGQLERLLRNDDSSSVGELWTEMERRIRRHLAQEEAQILPAYHAHDAAAAEEIEKAHDELRSQMRACRSAIRGGKVDVDALRSALQLYRVHQLHEDTTMYRWYAALPK